MNTYLKFHDELSGKSCIPLQEAENICDNYPGFSWIKDKSCTFVKANKNCSDFLKIPSPDQIIGATDFDFKFSTTGHTSYDFRLIDQCVLKGSEYNKKIELLVMKNQDSLFILVTKICIISDDYKPMAVLAIAQPLSQIEMQQLDGIATLAPTGSWTKELIPAPLTDAEHHVQILRNKFKLSPQEIAIIRNTSKRTVDTQIHKIRAKLYGNMNYRGGKKQ